MSEVDEIYKLMKNVQLIMVFIWLNLCFFSVYTMLNIKYYNIDILKHFSIIIIFTIIYNILDEYHEKKQRRNHDYNS